MDADPRDALIEQLRAENAQLRAENAQLRAENAQLRAENAQLRETIRKLQERLEVLERQAHRSAAPFRREERNKKPPEQHGRPGRKPGHPPAYRVRPDHVDEKIDVPLTACPRCGGPVRGVTASEQFIEDLPPSRPHVTHLVTYVGCCPTCGEVRSTHPLQVSTATGAAGTHLGSRALALAAQLSKQFGVTTRGCTRILQALGGLRLTPGGLVQALHRVASKAQDWYDDLAAGLRQQSSVHVDETSWWVGGPGHWLWGFTCPACTVYHVDASRGRDVVLDLLGDDFSGVLVSDCLASYENLPYIMQKCYAHHLKAIAAARDDRPPDRRLFFDELAGLLKSAVRFGTMRTDLPPEEAARIRRHLEARADALILPVRGDPEEERVAARLRKRRHWLFTFLDHPGVEPTNNRAERALRPAVIARKLSCGNKTQRGKRTWEVLASLTATCHQTARDFVEALRPHLLLQPA
jgi:transposase